MLRVEGLEELRLQLPLRQCGGVAPIRHPDQESVIGRLEVEEVNLSRPRQHLMEDIVVRALQLPEDHGVAPGVVDQGSCVHIA